MFYIDSNRCVRCGACARACPMGIFRMRDGAPATGSQKHCLFCRHCTAACPVQAVWEDGVPREALYPPAPQSPVEALIRARRRSIRHFAGTLPDKALILRALEGAEYCPSAKNQRMIRWSVLYGPERTAQARDLAVAWAAETGEAPELPLLIAQGRDMITCGAPCLLSALVPIDGYNPLTDAAVALATAELLLVDQGLSTCWAGYFTRACQASASLQALAGVPEGWRVACALMVGYAQGESYPNLPYRPLSPVGWVE